MKKLLCISFLSLSILSLFHCSETPEMLKVVISSSENSSVDQSSTEALSSNNNNESSNTSQNISSSTALSSNESPGVSSSSTSLLSSNSNPVIANCPLFSGVYPFTTEADIEPVFAVFSDGTLPDNSISASISLNDYGVLNINTELTDAQNQAMNKWATGEVLECNEITNGNQGWLFNVKLMKRKDNTTVNGFFMIHNSGWTTTNLSSVTAMKFDIKTTQDFDIMVESTNLDKKTNIGKAPLKGYADGKWHSVSIPIENFGKEMQWEFAKIYFKADGLVKDGPIYIDNFRFSNYEKNSAPYLHGDTKINITSVNGTGTTTINYFDDDKDAIQWRLNSEPGFGTVSLKDNKNGTITLTYTNTSNSSVDAFVVEFDDGHKNYKRMSFTATIGGGTVKPIGVYTDNPTGKYIPLKETSWWEGGGSEKPSDREGVKNDMLWDGGAYNGGIVFNFTKSGFIDITKMKSLTFDINFYDTTVTQWGLENVLIIASIEDQYAQSSTEWNRFAKEYKPTETDIPLKDEWQRVTIDLQYGQDSLSYTNANGTVITADKANIKSFSIAIYNGGGNFKIDNIVFIPKE